MKALRALLAHIEDFQPLSHKHRVIEVFHERAAKTNMDASGLDEYLNKLPDKALLVLDIYDGDFSCSSGIEDHYRAFLYSGEGRWLLIRYEMAEHGLGKTPFGEIVHMTEEEVYSYIQRQAREEPSVYTEAALILEIGKIIGAQGV